MSKDRAIDLALAALIVCAFTLAAFGIRQNSKAIDGFCKDLRTRSANTQQFLDTHEGGVLGFSRTVLETNLINQRRTLHSLCGDPEPK